MSDFTVSSSDRYVDINIFGIPEGVWKKLPGKVNESEGLDRKWKTFILDRDRGIIINWVQEK